MASGSIGLISNVAQCTGRIDWESHRNTNENYSTVSVSVYVVLNGWGIQGTGFGVFKINSEVVNTFSPAINIPKGGTGTVKVFEKSGIKVSHDNNGDGQIQLGCEMNFSFAGISSLSGSGIATMTHIDRWAEMISATDFNDEQNPSFTFSNPANTTVECWLEPNPNGEHIAIRTNIPNTGSYTWELTEEERNQLRAKCTNGNSCKCRIGLYSNIGENSQASYLDKRLTIVNANPTFNNFVYVNTNEDTKTKIQDDTGKIIVRGYSDVQVTISTANKAVAQKGATMVKYILKIGDKQVEAPYSADSTVTMQLDSVLDGEIKVYAVDSRKNSTLKSILADEYVPYYPLSHYEQRASVYRTDTISKETNLSMSVEYEGLVLNSDKNIRTGINTIYMQYRKTGDFLWSTIDESYNIRTNSSFRKRYSSNVGPDDKEYNSIGISGKLSGNEGNLGFSIENSYEVRFIIRDLLSEAIVETVLPSGKPNLSLSKNGIAIGSAYDENIGGLMQLQGASFPLMLENNVEVFTGMFIQGKKLYVKRVEIDTLPAIAGEPKYIDFGMSLENFSVQFIYGMCKSNDGYQYPIPFSYPQSLVFPIAVHIDNTNKIVVTVGTNRSSFTGWLYVFYVYDD